MAGVFSVLLGAMTALVFDGSLAISQSDVLTILFMGAFTIGLGIALVTTGTGYIPAAEVGLLVLIESVLGPIWPWVFLGEPVTIYEISGGVITLLAVAAFTIYSRNPRVPSSNKT